MITGPFLNHFRLFLLVYKFLLRTCYVLLNGYFEIEWLDFATDEATLDLRSSFVIFPKFKIVKNIINQTSPVKVDRILLSRGKKDIRGD